jgi:hypothetical protein
MIENRCKATAKSGNPFRAAATAGGLCFFHANPNKAAELGRMGGRKNRHGVSPDPLPALNTAKSVRDAVDRLIQGVSSGQLDPRVASSLAPLLNLQLRAIETSDIETRIAHLEQMSSNIRRHASDTANNENTLETAICSDQTITATESVKPDGS